MKQLQLAAPALLCALDAGFASGNEPKMQTTIHYVGLQYVAESFVENRVDALDGAIISVRDKKGPKRSLELNDGNIRDAAVVATMPLVVEIDLAGPTRIGTFRLYDGDPRNNRNPSGPSRSPGTLRSLDPGVSYRADWFDPRTGAWTQIDTDLRADNGRWKIPIRPDGDWVLVVRPSRSGRRGDG
jgi:hypothetical protein